MDHLRRYREFTGDEPRSIGFYLYFRPQKKEWSRVLPHINICNITVPLWEKIKIGLPHVKCNVNESTKYYWNQITMTFFNYTKIGSIEIKWGYLETTNKQMDSLEKKYNNNNGNIFKLLNDYSASQHEKKMETVYVGDFSNINVMKHKGFMRMLDEDWNSMMTDRLYITADRS